MYKLSINKNLFDSVLLRKNFVLEKENSNYWKKELLEPIIIDDILTYKIKQFEKIILTNGLGKDKPLLVVECKKVDYSIENGSFQFYLGKILEQKNTSIAESDKDILIKQLMEEREVLLEKLKLKE